jgi:hypothetical protein
VDKMLSPILRQIPGYGKQLLHGGAREIGKPPIHKRGPQAMGPAKKIPRTSTGVLEYGPMVIEKIASVDPMAAQTLQEVLVSRPDEIPDAIMELSQKMPQLFEKDPYNRVDGKIMDPGSKMKAIGDTMARVGLTNTQKIKIIDDLNMTGIFPDFPAQEA